MSTVTTLIASRAVVQHWLSNLLLLLVFASAAIEGHAQDAPASSFLFVENSEAVNLPDGATPTYGLSVGDLNSDGIPDVFANNHALPNSIFLNRKTDTGAFVWEDVAEAVDAEDFWNITISPGESTENRHAFDDTHGAAWIDVDNDGDDDLTIPTGVCCAPHFFINDEGILVEMGEEWGIGSEDFDNAGRHTAWYDSDQDGLLGMTFITRQTGSWLRNTASSFVLDDTAGLNCSDDQYAVMVDVAGDPNLELLCVSSGGNFVGDNGAWDLSTRPFTRVHASVPDVNDVMDVVLGDFDRNQRTSPAHSGRRSW